MSRDLEKLQGKTLNSNSVKFIREQKCHESDKVLNNQANVEFYSFKQMLRHRIINSIPALK